MLNNLKVYKMISGSVTLGESEVFIPESGYFKPTDTTVGFELFSDDLGSAVDIELQGSYATRFDTLQDLGEDIVVALAADSPVVRSYNVDKRLNVRLKVPAGTGTIHYDIAEG